MEEGSVVSRKRKRFCHEEKVSCGQIDDILFNRIRDTVYETVPLLSRAFSGFTPSQAKQILLEGIKASHSAEDLQKLAFVGIALGIVQPCFIPGFMNLSNHPEIECGGLTLTLWRQVLQYCSTYDKITNIMLTSKKMRTMVLDPNCWATVNAGQISSPLILRRWCPVWAGVSKANFKFANRRWGPDDLAPIGIHLKKMEELSLDGSSI